MRTEKNIKSQICKNNFCEFPLSLTTGDTMVTVAPESWFQIRKLKNKMRNNVDNGK